MNFLSQYYTDQAAKRSRPSDDPLTFLDYCTVKTDEEISRARDVLPDTSWDAVQTTTERSLLLDHLEWLADGGENVLPLCLDLFEQKICSVIGRLLETNDPEKLKALISIFDRVEGVPKLITSFKSFVTVSSVAFLPMGLSLEYRSKSLRW